MQETTGSGHLAESTSGQPADEAVRFGPILLALGLLLAAVITLFYAAPGLLGGTVNVVIRG